MYKPNKNITTATSAGIGGVLVGAGIATVATRVLSNKKARERAGKMIKQMSSRITHIAKREPLDTKSATDNSQSPPKSAARNGVVASTKNITEEAKEALQSKPTSDKEP